MAPPKAKQYIHRAFSRKPLKGRTILVTQASHQAKRFSGLLRQKGATVLTCPTIEIQPCVTSKTAEILKSIAVYDWLVFMSQNAAIYFFEQLKKYRISKLKLKGRRVAAIGKTTREILKRNHLRVHLVPEVHTSECLVKAFKGRVEEKRFLILSAMNGRTVVQDALRARGAQVEVLPLYRTLMPIKNSVNLKKYVCEEKIDAVTFTSPSTVHNFMKMLNPDRRLRRHLEMLTIASLGDITAAAVEANGLRVRVKPSDFTIPAFVNTLSREL